MYVQPKKIIMALVGTLFAGCLTRGSVLANMSPPPETNNSPKNISYQRQAVFAGENTLSGSSTAELPFGNVDYSV